MPFGFECLSVAFPIASCLILGATVFIAVRGLAQWARNNQSQRITPKPAS
ncbi:MAG: hypothetical protein LBD02_02875 [Christensenellaceae bacterium]|jgi:hypothetical protein|nr:hypothetical protein [Christensenellaceae bacterium]